MKITNFTLKQLENMKYSADLFISYSAFARSTLIILIFCHMSSEGSIIYLWGFLIKRDHQVRIKQQKAFLS